MAKIFVYKHWFCYLNVGNVKQKNSLFQQQIVLWLVRILITIGHVTDIFSIDNVCKREMIGFDVTFYSVATWRELVKPGRNNAKSTKM